MTPADRAVLETVDVTKIYARGSGAQTYALQGVTFRVSQGDFVAIIGPSGSGKSTLMNLIGALDRPTSGRIFIDGTDISKLPSVELARIRNKKIGFVFQSFNLLGRLSAVQNVEVPLLVSSIPHGERRRRALDLLTQLGVGSEANKKPGEMSGGQQQRVAVARALVTDPAIVLGDEPTGNLDTKNTDVVMDILERLNREYGKTVVVITHNNQVAVRARKIISIRDGKIEGIMEN